VVTIEDAKPNRPTFEIHEPPGLDPIHSIGIGGAKISGIAYSASGQELARPTISGTKPTSPTSSPSTWSDAATRSTASQQTRRQAQLRSDFTTANAAPTGAAFRFARRIVQLTRVMKARSAYPQPRANGQQRSAAPARFFPR
jgi:hypothetical protein